MFFVMDLIPYALTTPFFTQASIRKEEFRDLVRTLLNKLVLTEKTCAIFGNIIYSAYNVVLHNSSQHLESLLFFSWVLLSAYRPCKLKIHSNIKLAVFFLDLRVLSTCKYTDVVY